MVLITFDEITIINKFDKLFNITKYSNSNKKNMIFIF